MFSFFKKSQPDLEVPEWASFFNQRQYKEFLRAIEKYFYEKNVTYAMEAGHGLLTAEENDFGFSQMGLLNIAQVCGQTDISFYQRVVNEHFDLMVRTYAFNKAFGEVKQDYGKIKEYIGVRLYPDDYYAQTGKENTVGKDFAGNIYAMLVYDTEESIISVKPEDVEKWGKSFDEIFETGVKNIWDKYGVNLSEDEVEGSDIWIAQGEHFFTPNIAFDTETLEDLAGPGGLLVGLPNRHAALLYAINDIGATNFINSLIPLVYGMYNQGPGSLSDNIFWYKDGHFENLPYKVEDGTIVLSPPESFIEMLDALPSAEEE